MPVGYASDSHVLREPGRELWSMIRLNRPEWERRISLRFFHKSQTLMRIDTHCDFGICESREKVDECVDVELLGGYRLDMNSVNLHQITHILRNRAGEGGVPTFPRGALFEIPLPLQSALD